MNIPEELLYTEDHEWVMVEGDEATIGITEFAQHELGDVVFVELPEIGDDYDQFDEFGVIESVKAVSDVYMPASGEIIAINEELLDNPALINEDPFEGGWLIKIKLTNKDELTDLMDDQAYLEFIEEEEE